MRSGADDASKFIGGIFWLFSLSDRPQTMACLAFLPFTWVMSQVFSPRARTVFASGECDDGDQEAAETATGCSFLIYRKIWSTLRLPLQKESGDLASKHTGHDVGAHDAVELVNARFFLVIARDDHLLTFSSASPLLSISLVSSIVTVISIY